VDTDAIALKVKQAFATKEKAKLGNKPPATVVSQRARKSA